MKPIIAIISGLIAAAIPLTGFYMLWSWCMDQVPVANEWAGLIKIGITLALLLVGGSSAVVMAIVAGCLALTAVAALLS